MQRIIIIPISLRAQPTTVILLNKYLNTITIKISLGINPSFRLVKELARIHHESSSPLNKTTLPSIRARIIE